ncbi:outer membrane lipoprotein chaperone LolA [Oceanobacter mangrovi]|uniref:outer membrane lipoprotein chaperone LolA n=1 Tax=Oceanobacter mangrovi TaxID=2862510 RepID=UPI001C8E73C8|nr:outer membrane lipoprotein chaperone LolA [Oceanobacter mangrovi]
MLAGSKRFLMSFMLLVASVASLAAEPKSALDGFVERLGGTTTLTADFSQTVTDAQGQQLQAVTGHLALATPGKLRWETAPPFQQLVVSDGEVLWVFDEDLEQVTIRNLEMKVQETPALLLSGKADEVASNFDVERFSRNGLMVYRLTPKDHSQLFTALEFGYNGNDLQEMRIMDATGQLTLIKLNNVERNVKLDRMAFVFDVPEGADVIDARTEF